MTIFISIRLFWHRCSLRKLTEPIKTLTWHTHRNDDGGSNPLCESTHKMMKTSPPCLHQVNALSWNNIVWYHFWKVPLFWQIKVEPIMGSSRFCHCTWHTAYRFKKDIARRSDGTTRVEHSTQQKGSKHKAQRNKPKYTGCNVWRGCKRVHFWTHLANHRAWAFCHFAMAWIVWPKDTRPCLTCLKCRSSSIEVAWWIKQSY